ncbi:MULTISPECIES: hypothetical protein [unclassified Microcoleus]|nr:MULTISPECIES: hypothetical protein [unclassified Microcoleus]
MLYGKFIIKNSRSPLGMEMAIGNSIPKGDRQNLYKATQQQ